MFEFKGMRDIDARLGVNVLGKSPAFDGSRSVPVFVRRSPPNTPWSSDTFRVSRVFIFILLRAFLFSSL